MNAYNAQEASPEYRYVNTDAAWLIWCLEAEGLLGHDLDGDQEKDGYSLEAAYGAFLEGKTPTQYVASVMQ